MVWRKAIEPYHAWCISNIFGLWRITCFFVFFLVFFWGGGPIHIIEKGGKNTRKKKKMGVGEREKKKERKRGGGGREREALFFCLFFFFVVFFFFFYNYSLLTQPPFRPKIRNGPFSIDCTETETNHPITKVNNITFESAQRHLFHKNGDFVWRGFYYEVDSNHQ